MNELIFISYTRNDSEFALALANAFENQEYKIWIDKNHISENNRIQDTIRNGLEKCTAMIILLNEYSFSSNYIREELDYAFNNNRLFNKILPVYISKNNVINFEKLPWILKKMKFMVVNNDDYYSRNTKKIIEEFKKLMEEK